jgi:A/G-specific adenine glycosylase
MKLSNSLTPDLTTALLDWYDKEARSLPWREHPGSGKNNHPDPYAVLVSEIMLQQTTVQAVIPYFNRWMERYPTIVSLAKASEEEVLRFWEGLGYYSRARNLHRTARETMSRYGGRLPEDAGELRTLPGVGEYTSGAVASIAYGKREPAVDANIFRVLSRLLAISRDPECKYLATDAAVRRYLFRIAGRLIPPERPGDFNQALMDLGSSICRPSNPLCTRCPLERWCRACNLGLTGEIPQRGKTAPIQFLEAALGIVQRNGKVLIQRRSVEGLFAGMWEFPGGKLARGSMGEGEHGREAEKNRRGDAGTSGQGGARGDRLEGPGV